MICVLTAMEEELEGVLELLGGGLSEEKPIDWPGGGSLYRGRIGRNSVVVGTSGMGKVCAASMTELLAHIYKPRALILCGVAGGLTPDIEVGDLVLATSVYQWDMGVIGLDGFDSVGSSNPGTTSVHEDPWQADPVLLELARESARSLGVPRWEGRLHEGAVVTGDKMVFSRPHREWLARNFGALALDMESGALAQVAAGREIPFLILRGISDRLGAEYSSLHRVFQRSDMGPVRIALRRGSTALFHPVQGMRILKLASVLKAATLPAAALLARMLEERDLVRQLG